MWYKRAQVGDKVVCVKEPNRCDDLASPIPLLKIGAIYTIKIIIPYDWCDSGISLDLGLSDYPSYRIDAACFRPVQKTTTKTGMAILNKILERENVEATDDIIDAKKDLKELVKKGMAWRRDNLQKMHIVPSNQLEKHND